MTIEAMLKLTEAIGDQAVRHAWHSNVSGAIFCLAITVFMVSLIVCIVWIMGKVID